MLIKHRMPVAAVLCLFGTAMLQGCGDLRRAIGLEHTMPDEFAVESRAPLTIPPDFDLRPPRPGAVRPQEKTADQAARQALEQAGPGKGETKSADLGPEAGPPPGGGPDPNAQVAPESLSGKLLGYDGAGGAAAPAPAPVESRKTTPLKEIY